MAGDEKEQDRSEQATPFKLREARKRGQVAKSVELTAWAIMLTAAVFVYIFGTQLIRGELGLASALFSQVGSIPLSTHNALSLFGQTLLHLLSVFLFFIVAILGVGLLINFFQTGPVFSWTPMQPDFSRINPATGFKKLFNIRIVYELFKSLLKVALLGGVTWWYFKDRLGALMGLLHQDIAVHPVAMLGEALTLTFWLLAVMAALALFDFAFVKWEFGKNMRMSRRELKEEVKRREGDPKVKAKIRELQREAALRGASLNRVADADVVITNPTHISVAVRYVRGEMPAPVVIAKGAGELALRMRGKARQCQVPLVENRPLARKLFERVGIDQPIVPETYALVARILTSIYKNEKRKA
jgi:flagellar biosynthesis protein FlhB